MCTIYTEDIFIIFLFFLCMVIYYMELIECWCYFLMQMLDVIWVFVWE
jgi:hypothetical protein